MKCQVGSASHLEIRFPTLIPCSLTGHCPKALIVLQAVGNLLVFKFKGKSLISILQAISYVSLVSASLLVVARAYVSFHSFKPGQYFPNQALIEAFSIAIWNKNKFAMAIAVISWVTNVSVIIQGKSFPFYSPVDYRESHNNMILY
jgi:hypothetical protein